MADFNSVLYDPESKSFRIEGLELPGEWDSLVGSGIWIDVLISVFKRRDWL